MRLIRRSDISLAAALIVGAFVVFQRPLRGLLDFAHEIEQRYHVDLMAGLTLLGIVFVFHQYQKSQQARAEVATMGAEAEQARARSADLEHLVGFGQALANALDPAALQQVLWQKLPEFVAGRGCWMLSRSGERWDCVLQDATATGVRPADVLEELAGQALSHRSPSSERHVGVTIGDEICLPLAAGGTVVGVLGIRNEPALTAREQRALGAAAATIAIAVRNVQLMQEIREHGERDGLTGCLNRAHGIRMLQSELRRARRTGCSLSIVMFDVDHFKTINDTGGHLRGDAVLAAVGARMGEVLRSTDVRCRYGGDEFLVILPDTPVLGAQQVAECLRRSANDLALADGEAASITLSLGVAAAIPGELDPAEVIARADQALYRAKREGRNRFCLAAARSLHSGQAAPTAAAG